MCMQFAEYVLRDGRVIHGDFAVESQAWTRRDLEHTRHDLTAASYGVEAVPVDFHCHGVGLFDFSDIPTLRLDRIERQLADEGCAAILTLYLPRGGIPRFEALMAAYDDGRRSGKYEHILGAALEGPLLASHGGTPKPTVWSPTRGEWLRLAACGPLGLQYVVLSPDADLSTDGRRQSVGDAPPPRVEWIAACLLEAGVRPALGHFRKDQPESSAAMIREILDVARRCGSGPEEYRVVSDHLFNDMPLRCRHAWRTPAERARRAAELAEIRLEDWTASTLHDRAGPVLAELVRGAMEGRLTPCLNFDGDHVDGALCSRIVELVGPTRIIAMTDRVQGSKLGGQWLRRTTDNTLLYQEDSIVAAGTQSPDGLIRNMRSWGIAEIDIWRLIAFNALDLLEGAHRPMRIGSERWSSSIRPADPTLPDAAAR